MEIPKINREEVDFTTDSEICNVGFYEGEKDNRPFRIEVWSSYGIDVATFFISTLNLKEEDVKAFINSTETIDIIEDEIKFQTIENDGNEFYSVNIPLRDKDKVYSELKVDLKSYEF